MASRCDVPQGVGNALRYAFENLNAGKRLISLDLKTDEGRETLLALADKADVLFDNFSPGTLDGLGLGPAALRARNPRLVYGQGTGYGTSGPARDNVAMDLTVQLSPLHDSHMRLHPSLGSSLVLSSSNVSAAAAALRSRCRRIWE